MRRHILIGVFLLVAALVVGGVFLFRFSTLGGKRDVAPPPATQTVEVPLEQWGEYWTPSVPPESIPADDPLRRIDTSTLGTTLDEQGDVEVDQTGEYVITYYAPESTVYVTLHGLPLADARKHAEDAFLRKFGVTKEEACRMKVILNAVGAVDPNATTDNYGLSFCPGAVPLP